MEPAEVQGWEVGVEQGLDRPLRPPAGFIEAVANVRCVPVHDQQSGSARALCLQL